MATSLPPVTIPDNTWIDLYNATGITVGIALVIQNSGSGEASLTESATSPTGSNIGINPIQPRGFYQNDSGNVGAWAKSNVGTTLQIEVA